MRTIDLSGKVALVLGVANKRSLAWAIADALGEAGCSLALTYQGERLQKNVRELAKKYPDTPVMACDVNSDEQVGGVFDRIQIRIHYRASSERAGEGHGQAGIIVHKDGGRVARRGEISVG